MILIVVGNSNVKVDHLRTLPPTISFLPYLSPKIKSPAQRGYVCQRILVGQRKLKPAKRRAHCSLERGVTSARRHCICEVSDPPVSYAVELVNWGDIVAMITRIPVFQQEAVCLTKFGPELGETAKEILTRKDLERRSGIRAHKNEFWWGIGDKSTAQSITNLISQYDAAIVLFSAIKNQEPLKNGSPSDAFVWRKYRVLGGDILQDIPKHVLITSNALTKSGTVRKTYFALICNSSMPIKMGGHVFRFANQHYKNISKDGTLGKAARGQRTTTALVRWTTSPISGAECDSLIDLSAQLCAPYCVELFDPKPISSSTVAGLNWQIAEGMRLRQWLLAVATIRL